MIWEVMFKETNIPRDENLFMAKAIDFISFLFMRIPNKHIRVSLGSNLVRLGLRVDV